MNRRSFLASLAAVPFLDPERLLWIPKQKTIFILERKIITDGVLINIERTRQACHLHNGLATSGDVISFLSFTELDPVSQEAYKEWERFWGHAHGSMFLEGERRYAPITF